MKYFVIAGEASGDLHASNLMRELARVDNKAQFQFLGGDKMASVSNVEPIIHYRQMAFMGFWAVIKNIRTISNNLTCCKNAIKDFQPDVVILVDYPSFNLRIAEFVKKNLPKTKVFYYISPKIWAWKEYRIKAIKKYIDKMFTIFPFETEFYQKHNYPVHYVGNPTVDFIYEKKEKCPSFDNFCQQNSLSKKPIIALLAGSRKQEIQHCLPKMLKAVEPYSDYQIVIGKVSSVEMDFYTKIIGDKNVKILEDKTTELVANSKMAVVNSGTASLETAINNTPQVVVYHVAGGKFTLWLKDIILKVKYISLVNLIAERMLVKELIGYFFTVENLQKEIENILNNQEYREKILTGYAEVQTKLGRKNASKNCAERMFQLLQTKQ